LAGAEEIQGATDFWLSVGEAGGGEKCGVDLARFAGGKKRAGRFGGQFFEESEGAGGGF